MGRLWILIIAFAIAGGGVAVSFLLSERWAVVETLKRHELALREVERSTDLLLSGLNEGHIALSLMARGYGSGGFSTASHEGEIAGLVRDYRDLGSVMAFLEFERLTLLRRDGDGAHRVIGPEGADPSISTQAVDGLVSSIVRTPGRFGSATITDTQAFSGPMLVQWVILDRSDDGAFDAALGWIDFETFLTLFMTRFPPDGLVLRLMVDSDGRTGEGGMETVFGAAEPSAIVEETVSMSVSQSGELWELNWDILPSFRTGIGIAISRVILVVGSLVFIVLGLVVGWVMLMRQGARAFIEARTTELEEEVRAARDSARAKSDFLANMSHELRTPLNSIIGFSEVMEKQIKGPESWEAYKAYSEDIRQSGEHLLAVINDVLDLSKAEAGHLQLSEHVVSPRDLIDSAVRLIHEKIRNRGLELKISVEDSGLLLRCDERRIKQVLLNLLSNAAKFTPRGGRITISTNADDQEYCIEVADTGIGMRAEQVPAALEKYTQFADGASTSEDVGTGLGLHMSRVLSELHGGRLSVRSKPGEGTRVTIHFPASRVVSAPKG